MLQVNQDDRSTCSDIVTELERMYKKSLRPDKRRAYCIEGPLLITDLHYHAESPGEET